MNKKIKSASIDVKHSFQAKLKFSTSSFCCTRYSILVSLSKDLWREKVLEAGIKNIKIFQS